VLRRMFGRKREEVAGDWRRLHNEELHNLYTSPNIIRALKSRRVRLAMNVALMGGMRNTYKILVGKRDGGDHSEDLGVIGKTVVELILGK